MINQIAPVPTASTRMTSLDKDLLKVRHIQAHVKEIQASYDKPKTGVLWDPATAAPYVVQVTRWIE